ncbi:serine/threonine protein kinase [Nocardia yunnanensis]|uniref:non-specific serine/threonine protein kinase n=1 Tax=Nocardia yunnanensis TaxID=2382165 RepID=A0A386Z602_9NOCA|nr:serine/threonine-protein kinase [Nocardia yunnanensis]AYF72663.1 serine/threonine protein kinase [Nocardia yunnanensis]
MLRSGERFAGYEIERELGRGGMGAVYLARHPRLPRLIALKLLSRDVFGDVEVRRRFEREADLVARLDHPNIVPVYDRGIDDAQPWIAMRYIDGPDAAQLEAANLPPRQAVRIIAETAKALDFAHRRGVLHRDVKPANILLEYVDGEERVFLADFGIARLRDDATKLTQTGSFTATLAFASPEQLSGQPLDARSDQYSLACTLFRLLTGDVPFNAEHPVGIIHGHLNQPVPPVSALRAGLPPSLDSVLARALAKHPEARFDSCAEFAHAAQQALDNPVGATRVLPHSPFAATPSTAPPATAVAQPMAASAHKPATAAYTRQAPAPASTPPRPVSRAVARPPKKRSKLRGCLLGTAAIIILPLVGIGGCLAALDRNQTSHHPASTSAEPAPPPQDTETSAPETTDPAAGLPEHSGADAAVLSQRFPQMLPHADPNSDSNSGTGYQGAACTTYQHSAPPPDTGSGDPDLGNWAVAWDCQGGVGHPAFRFVMYRSAADAEEALGALNGYSRTDIKVHGNRYTNYQLSNSQLLRPRLVTEFHKGEDKHAFVMYSTGFLTTDDQLLEWFKAAPLN